MKTKAFILTLALCLSAGLALAASPQMGSWKLNEKESKLPAGMPRNHSVVYQDAGKMIKVTVDGTDKAGKHTHNEWTGKFDGKDYPVTGDAMSDMRSYAKVNDHTLNIRTMKGGKVTSEGQIVVSADGKTRTVTIHGMDHKGKKFTSVGVYDKQ